MMMSAPFSEETERAAHLLEYHMTMLDHDRVRPPSVSSSNRIARTSLWTLRTAMYPDYRISLSRLLSTFHHTGVYLKAIVCRSDHANQTSGTADRIGRSCVVQWTSRAHIPSHSQARRE